MKATIEFDLPSEHDAYLDAINGSRWRELVRHIHIYVSKLRDTDKNPECREGYRQLLMCLREDLADAGLTFASSRSLQKDYVRVHKLYVQKVLKYYQEQEASELAKEQGIFGASTPASAGPKRRRPKHRSGNSRGKGGDNPSK